MPENNTSPGDPLVQPPDSPSYQPIPPELGQILDDHKVWLESGGRSGKQANLPNYDFKGLDLSQVNLERANLEGAQFQKAKLAGANLKQTRLRGADFSEADVAGTDFRDADLEKVELASSTDLDIPLLARADLGDCDLPEDRQEFPVLDYVAEASRTTSHIFVTLMIGAGYVGVTVFTTSDVVLLTNTGTTSLPILGNVISMAWFYIAAPFLLLATYIYFHLSLQHLWEALATLPAVFPDGQRLDQKVYPWLFNWLPSYYFVQLKDRRPYFARLQCVIARFFAWYFLPLILLVVWFRYLYVRDPITLWHLMILTAAAWFCFRFCHFAKITLQGHTWRRGKGILPDVAKTLGVLLLLVFVTRGFVGGYPARLEAELMPRPLSTYDSRKLVPEILDYLGISIVVNFEEEEVSTKYPKRSTSGKDKANGEDIFIVKGAPLKNRNLRHAYARGAFMVRADLRGARLRGAYLREANLKEAKAGEAGYRNQRVEMPYAFLHKANLTGACLYNANLYRANLTNAKLKDCDLERAYLKEAQLNYANLQGAKLKGASLWAANIQGAVLEEANLLLANFQVAKGLGAKQLRAAKNWSLAFYDKEMIRVLKLPLDHNYRVKNKKFGKYYLNGVEYRYDLHNAALEYTNLDKADFRGANLRRADLSRAELRSADLRGADLTGADLTKALMAGADLRGADLRGVRGLTKGQLAQAKVDSTTKLP